MNNEVKVTVPRKLDERLILVAELIRANTMPAPHKLARSGVFVEPKPRGFHFRAALPKEDTKR